jgi:hypothetical protein
MAAIKLGTLASLAFWARNMVFYRRRGREWPFFNYTDAEWARMVVLAAAAQPQFQTFLVVNTMLFLVLAALGMAIVFLPLATVLFPVPAQTPELAFALLLLGSACLIVAGGLPITMWLAAFFAADAVMKAKLVPLPGDGELAAKVRWQFWRIMLVMSVVLAIVILFARG